MERSAAAAFSGDTVMLMGRHPGGALRDAVSAPSSQRSPASALPVRPPRTRSSGRSRRCRLFQIEVDGNRANGRTVVGEKLMTRRGAVLTASRRRWRRSPGNKPPSSRRLITPTARPWVGFAGRAFRLDGDAVNGSKIPAPAVGPMKRAPSADGAAMVAACTQRRPACTATGPSTGGTASERSSRVGRRHPVRGRERVPRPMARSQRHPPTSQAALRARPRGPCRRSAPCPAARRLLRSRPVGGRRGRGRRQRAECRICPCLPLGRQAPCRIWVCSPRGDCGLGERPGRDRTGPQALFLAGNADGARLLADVLDDDDGLDLGGFDLVLRSR